MSSILPQLVSITERDCHTCARGLKLMLRLGTQMHQVSIVKGLFVLLLISDGILFSHRKVDKSEAQCEGYRGEECSY